MNIKQLLVELSTKGTIVLDDDEVYELYLSLPADVKQLADELSVREALDVDEVYNKYLSVVEAQELDEFEELPQRHRQEEISSKLFPRYSQLPEDAGFIQSSLAAAGDILSLPGRTIASLAGGGSVGDIHPSLDERDPGFREEHPIATTLYDISEGILRDPLTPLTYGVGALAGGIAKGSSAIAKLTEKAISTPKTIGQFGKQASAIGGALAGGIAKGGSAAAKLAEKAISTPKTFGQFALQAGAIGGALAGTDLALQYGEPGEYDPLRTVITGASGIISPGLKYMGGKAAQRSAGRLGLGESSPQGSLYSEVAQPGFRGDSPGIIFDKDAPSQAIKLTPKIEKKMDELVKGKETIKATEYEKLYNKSITDSRASLTRLENEGKISPKQRMEADAIIEFDIGRARLEGPGSSLDDDALSVARKAMVEPHEKSVFKVKQALGHAYNEFPHDLNVKYNIQNGFNVSGESPRDLARAVFSMEFEKNIAKHAKLDETIFNEVSDMISAQGVLNRRSTSYIPEVKGRDIALERLGYRAADNFTPIVPTIRTTGDILSGDNY